MILRLIIKLPNINRAVSGLEIIDYLFQRYSFLKVSGLKNKHQMVGNLMEKYHYLLFLEDLLSFNIKVTSHQKRKYYHQKNMLLSLEVLDWSDKLLLDNFIERIGELLSYQEVVKMYQLYLLLKL